MVVGVDVSSRRIDIAWLENGKPQRWHQELGDPKKVPLIDRLRAIDIRWPGYRPGMAGIVGHEMEEVTEVAIEYPWARGNGVPALWATVGVITRQAPTWARVGWPEPGDLRAAIGAKNTKQAAHERIRWEIAWTTKYTDQPERPPLDDWNEHELDALVACIGWTRILQANEDAA